MSGDELSAAYASGDVFMMPSESETLGFVALEAMASGLPVVAVAAGGLTDILTNPGVTGLPCPCPWPCTLITPIVTVMAALTFLEACGPLGVITYKSAILFLPSLHLQALRFVKTRGLCLLTEFAQWLKCQL